MDELPPSDERLREMLLAYVDDLRIHIETMTRCGGSCGGCALEAEDRSDGRLLSRERLDGLTPFIQSFIEGHASRTRLREISINCTQADHLLAPPEQLADLVRWIAEAGMGKAIGFFTASAVGKRDRVLRAVDAIREASLKASQPLWLDLVFDPGKTSLAKFAGVYRDNIETIRGAFGDVDLNINVGPDTPLLVRPADLHAFLEHHQFLRFTMNLTPIASSSASFALAWSSIRDWICEFLDLWDPSKGCEVNVSQIFSTFAFLSDDRDQEDMRLLGEAVAKSASRSIFVAPDGSLSHTQAGFGDVPFAPRFGWKTTRRAEGDGYAASVDSARAFAARVCGKFLSDPSCAACQFRTVCPRTGIAALRGVMDGRLAPDVANGCPVGMREVLGRYLDYGERGTLRDQLCVKDFSYVPEGFDPAIRTNARSLRRRRLDALDFADLRTRRAAEAADAR